MEQDYSNNPILIANIQKYIQSNPYPGRGIVIGKNSLGQWTQVYWIMGRSANSRNRVFTYHNHMLQTEAADPSKVEDPSLIIYNAMRELDQNFIVTNGTQTDTIYDGMSQGASFGDSLLSESHEPDAPNYTPRISGLIDLTQELPQLILSIIKVHPLNPDHSEYQFFRYNTAFRGCGYTITTYRGDGNPLPSFEGSPYMVPLQGNAQQIANTFWDALDEDNRISLAVKTIDPRKKESHTLVVNKYDEV